MRWGVRAALALVLPLFLAGCWGRYDWHQEVRLLIATPQGDVEARAVQAVEAQYWPEWLQINNFAVDRTLTGEAVVADLGEGRYLFALLGGPGLAEGVFKDLGVWPEVFRRIERQAGEPARDVPRKYWPRLVSFGDINDPTTVQQVDPDNLAASFGAGHALREVTLAITHEPVTTGVVEGVLGWLEAVGRSRANLKGKPDQGRVSDQPQPHLYLIAPSDFSTELYK